MPSKCRDTYKVHDIHQWLPDEMVSTLFRFRVMLTVGTVELLYQTQLWYPDVTVQQINYSHGLEFRSL